VSAPLHDAEGWWLADAGPVEPRPPLAGDATLDVLVVGGGFTGLWTAWWLGEQAPGLRVGIVESRVCGHGPSGRNGGFLNSYWYSAGNLRERLGLEGARAVTRAGAEIVPGVGRWCEEQGVDAWFRPAGHLVVSAAPAQDGAWDRAVEACRALGAPDEYGELSPDEVRSRCASPVFRGGALMRAAATVHPARLALGLRARLVARGVAVWERSPVRRLEDGPSGVVAHTGSARVRAGAAVLATGAAAVGARPLKRRLTVASSHIVLTEPVPDVLEEVGWTGGEAISDARAYLHYFRTTDDGRVLYGWAGGRMAYGARVGGRVGVDPDVAAAARRHLVRTFPSLAGRRVERAWGGPIDVSPSHLPFFGTAPGGRVHYGVGYTGNGVGPTWLGGRVLAGLALDRRDGWTALPLVEPPPALVPPEPLRWVGGQVIRGAVLRKEAREEEGRGVDPITRFVADVPRRLGVHIGR
jgi:glycine/D-amino acid oxidase-like deaminating enzyme